MTQTLDIMDEVANHCAAALKYDGAPVTRSGDAYRGRLAVLDGAQRAEVIEFCRNEGCTATFGEANYGGTNLTIRKATT